MTVGEAAAIRVELVTVESLSPPNCTMLLTAMPESPISTIRSQFRREMGRSSLCHSSMTNMTALMHRYRSSVSVTGVMLCISHLTNMGCMPQNIVASVRRRWALWVGMAIPCLLLERAVSPAYACSE